MEGGQKKGRKLERGESGRKSHNVWLDVKYGRSYHGSGIRTSRTHVPAVISATGLDTTHAELHVLQSELVFLLMAGVWQEPD